MSYECETLPITKLNPKTNCLQTTLSPSGSPHGQRGQKWRLLLITRADGTGRSEGVLWGCKHANLICSYATQAVDADRGR